MVLGRNAAYGFCIDGVKSENEPSEYSSKTASRHSGGECAGYEDHQNRVDGMYSKGYITVLPWIWKLCGDFYRGEERGEGVGEGVR
jgi:hypothetical protein